MESKFALMASQRTEAHVSKTDGIVNCVDYTHNTHIRKLHYRDTDTAVDEISNELIEPSFWPATFGRASIYKK